MDAASGFSSLLSAIGIRNDGLLAEALRLHSQPPATPFRLSTSVLGKVLRVRPISKARYPGPYISSCAAGPLSFLARVKYFTTLLVVQTLKALAPVESRRQVEESFMSLVTKVRL